MGACGNGFGNITGETDTAISDYRDSVLFQRCGHVGNRRNLGHTNTRHNTGGADGTGANAYLYCIRAGFRQGERRM